MSTTGLFQRKTIPLALRQQPYDLAYVEVTEARRMSDERLDLPRGTLDLLILKTLALESLHGWVISERLQQISGEALQVQQGSLYPDLHRLERRGWIKAHWDISENNRRA